MEYSEEEKKDIKRCNELIKDIHKEWIGISNQKAIETILNLIEKQQKENEKAYLQGFNDSEEKYNTVIADNMKKDKVIDLMAVYISNMHDNINSRLFGGPCFESIQQVKQRFYKKVEENEQ